MLANRSMPGCTVIPTLAYPDVGEVVNWLCDAVGFTLRLRIANHRAQLNVGNGAIVITQQQAADWRVSHALMVRVEDVEHHYEIASQHGAKVLRSPVDYLHGERQYCAEDFAGHRWTFSQSVADVDPKGMGWHARHAVGKRPDKE